MRKAAADGRNPFLVLLAMRNTPTEGIKYSPAQRIFGRSTRTNLPVTVDSRRPCSIPAQVASERLTENQTKEKTYYDQHVKDLPELKHGDNVNLKPLHRNAQWAPATVTQKVGPRSYKIATNEGGRENIRNRRHLSKTPVTLIAQPDTGHTGKPYVTRSGRVSKEPERWTCDNYKWTMKLTSFTL